MPNDERPTHSGKGFDSLKNFVASNKTESTSAGSNTGMGIEKVNAPLEKTPEIQKEQKFPEEALKLSESSPERAEAKTLADRIVTLVNQRTLSIYNNDLSKANRYLVASASGNQKKYYGIHSLVSGSYTRDVSYEVNRWLGNDIEYNSELQQICEKLIKRGLKMQIVTWIRSLSHAQDAYGRGSTVAERRKNKLLQAQEAAKRAGLSLEEVAKEYKLSDLLND